jgi:hypothetical protein
MDPADVTLDPHLVSLADVLASHVHETWSRIRRGEGWRVGPRRDDDRKEHPLLLAYDALPESEKACDREVALAVLKAVVAAGFDIRKRDIRS